MRLIDADELHKKISRLWECVEWRNDFGEICMWLSESMLNGIVDEVETARAIPVAELKKYKYGSLGSVINPQGRTIDEPSELLGELLEGFEEESIPIEWIDEWYEKALKNANDGDDIAVDRMLDDWRRRK